jgi:hypothetical protein
VSESALKRSCKDIELAKDDYRQLSKMLQDTEYYRENWPKYGGKWREVQAELYTFTEVVETRYGFRKIKNPFTAVSLLKDLIFELVMSPESGGE